MSRKKKLSQKQLKDLEIVSNEGLVHRVAQQYKQYCSSGAFTYYDLVQEGLIGLITARDKFNPKKGARFSTYANFWIRAKILRMLEKYSSTMHVTFSASATYHQLVKKYGAFGDMIEDLLDKIKAEYLKGKISYKDYKRFVDVLQAKSPDNYTHISIDNPPDRYLAAGTSNGPQEVSKDSSGLDMDILTHLSYSESPEDHLTRTTLVDKILVDLPPQDKEMIELYYGLKGGTPWTYEQLSKKYKKSKQRIHQWHKNVATKLKKKLKKLCREDGLSSKEIFGE